MFDYRQFKLPGSPPVTKTRQLQSCIIFNDKIEEITLRLPACYSIEPDELIEIAEVCIKDTIFSEAELKTGFLEHRYHIHCRSPEVSEPLASYHPENIVRKSFRLSESWNARVAGSV